MPLTGDNRWGFLLLATRPPEYDTARIVLPAVRDPGRFEATSIGWVGIFPCIGGRDENAAKQLQDALPGLRRGSGPSIPFEALYRGDPGPELMDSVWYHGPGFWLERGSTHNPP
jgi:protein-L-isoaspartate(D-aspartate) O-methyltransferase